MFSLIKAGTGPPPPDSMLKCPKISHRFEKINIKSSTSRKNIKRTIRQHRIGGRGPKRSPRVNRYISMRVIETFCPRLICLDKTSLSLKNRRLIFFIIKFTKYSTLNRGVGSSPLMVQDHRSPWRVTKSALQ